MPKAWISRAAAGAMVSAALMAGSLALAATAASACTGSPNCGGGPPPAAARTGTSTASVGPINCPPPNPQVKARISDC